MEHSTQSTLPPYLISGPSVWMESEAVDQLRRLAQMPGCVRAVGLPDLHPGPGGTPIGAAAAFEHCLMPQLLGSDVGCGVRLCLTNQRRPSLDRLERDVDRAFSGEHVGILADAGETALSAVLARGVRAFTDLAEGMALPNSLVDLAENEPPHSEPEFSPVTDGPVTGAEHLMTLGTIGGGNHFAEVAAVAEIADAELARQFGVTMNSLAILVHSGSRSLGQTLANRWGNSLIPIENAAPYLEDYARTCRFARANRFIVAWRLLAAIGSARTKHIRWSVDAIHNGISRERVDGHELWIHRKGAAPASPNELTVVLGTRGSRSWLLQGTGDSRALNSLAHGAGRRMTRAEALSKMKAKHRRESLERTRLGGRILCDRTELLYEEHPEAYKSVETVVDALVDAGLARRVAALEPLITVKR